MKLVFADAFYFIALLNAHDAANARAGEFTQRYSGQYVTTTATLIELADAFSNPSTRLAAGRFLGDLPASKAMRIVHVDMELFQAGIELYRARQDKDWSLTDCISFVVMQREDITDALTGDRHFEQAGFKALLK